MASNPNKDHEEDELSHVCHICKKGFISGQALGGHMRVHSDLAASVPPGWSVTAKRGRERLPSCRSFPPPVPGIELRILKPVVDLYSVVCIKLNHRGRSDTISLISSSNSSGDKSERTAGGDHEIMDGMKRRKTARKMEVLHTCSICGKSFASYQALGGHKSGHYQKSNKTQSDILKVDETEKVSVADEHDYRSKTGVQVHSQDPNHDFSDMSLYNSSSSNDESERTAIGDYEVMDEMKRRKRAREMELLESETAEPNRYTCNICGKSFPSYQALGGHTRHCRKSNETQRNMLKANQERKGELS